MAQKYTTVRMLTSTHRLIKIEAAKRVVPIATLLDEAVKREIKTVRKAK